MVELNWTDNALNDLENIGQYISKDSERYAKSVIQNLFKSTEILIKFPKAGRIVPEFKNKAIRELIRGNYRIVYRILESNRIDIITIHHSARLLKKT